MAVWGTSHFNKQPNENFVLHFFLMIFMDFCLLNMVVKMRQDRADNMILRAKNQNLKAENLRLQSAIRDLICPNCGGPAILGEMSYEKLYLGKENACLKQEVYIYHIDKLRLN